MEKKKLCLVDVSAMYFRAFYAIRPLTNAKGLPTNALYGFLSMTAKLLRDLKPTHLAYCFDTKDGSFRNEMYSEYKANRKEMPEELVPQVPYIRKLTDAMNIPAFEMIEYEADDIIGMFAELARNQEDTEVIIVSGDKDFAQLVGDNVKMFDPMKDKFFDPAAVVEKWEVRPDQIIDYLSMVGDSSDNVPGVKGIGPKGAVKLLQEFNTLENIYENLDSISAKGTRTKLQENKDMAFKSKELVTIITQNHTNINNIEELKYTGPHKDQIEALMEELEFKNMGKRLLVDSAYASGMDVASIQSPKEDPFVESHGLKIDDLKSELDKYKVVSTSAKELQQQLEKIKEVYFFVLSDKAYFADDSTIYEISYEELESNKVKFPANLKWKAHDLKSLWRSFHIENAIASFDSMIAEYIIKARNIGAFHELVDLYYHASHKPDINQAVQYLAAMKQIEKFLIENLERVHGLKSYLEVELPLVPILLKMELNGIELDSDILHQQSIGIKEDLERLKQEIYEATGNNEFNIDSTKQLAKVLFEDMGLPVVKKTKTGFSTNSDVLQKLSSKYPFTQKIIDYRELKKLLSTYVEALPKLVNDETHRIHTHFNQAVTATGRLSSTEPNLQNIPIRTMRGNEVRKAFIAPKGKKLISADYSQIELRMLAHITNDPGLCEAFAEDKDIHTATAASVFGVKFDEVDSEMRRKAKAINFGIAYGMGAFTLAENLGISRKESKDIIDQYFNNFKNVKDYMSSVVEEAKANGYVESIFGRRRHIEELKSSNAMIRKNGERIAINTPMQGSASDIVKKAMIDLKDLTNSKLLLQVHDELIFEVDEDKVDELIPIIKEKMEKVVDLKVPLKVNVAVGENWKDAH